MKVLITGGAGFIGSHTAERLLERGDRVCVIDNFATGRRDNLTPHKNLTLIEGSVADEELTAKTFETFGPEYVVHAAASYKDPNDWTEDVRTNVVGTSVVSKCADRAGIRRMIYFQTSLCYGLHPVEQPITISHPVRPEGSSYAISKTIAEQIIAMGKTPFVSLRLANAYGPRNISGPLPTFFRRLSDGQKCFVMNTRRDFIFVDDLVRIVLMALDGQGKENYYHVSSGRDYAVEELYRAVVTAMKLDPAPDCEKRERNPDDVFSILLDPSQTHRDFDWRIETPLEEGVRRAVEYYRKFGLSQTFTHLKAMDK